MQNFDFYIHIQGHILSLYSFLSIPFSTYPTLHFRTSVSALKHLTPAHLSFLCLTFPLPYPAPQLTFLSLIPTHSTSALKASLSFNASLLFSLHFTLLPHPFVLLLCDFFSPSMFLLIQHLRSKPRHLTQTFISAFSSHLTLLFLTPVSLSFPPCLILIILLHLSSSPHLPHSFLLPSMDLHFSLTSIPISFRTTTLVPPNSSTSFPSTSHLPSSSFPLPPSFPLTLMAVCVKARNTVSSRLYPLQS